MEQVTLTGVIGIIEAAGVTGFSFPICPRSRRATSVVLVPCRATLAALDNSLRLDAGGFL